MDYRVEGYDGHNQELDVVVSATDAVQAMNKARLYYRMTVIISVSPCEQVDSEVRLPEKLGAIHRFP